ASMVELPRPLRDLDLRDDLWLQFCPFLGATLLSYGWIVLALGMRNGRQAIAFAGTVLVVGTVLFPAILLTLATSGSLLNLRPDRIFGVIGKLGFGYVGCVIAWTLALVTYGVGVLGTNVML